MKYDSDIFKEIKDLEQLQLRSLVDHALDPDDAEAKHRMLERRAKIVKLRDQLSMHRELK